LTRAVLQFQELVRTDILEDLVEPLGWARHGLIDCPITEDQDQVRGLGKLFKILAYIIRTLSPKTNGSAGILISKPVDVNHMSKVDQFPMSVDPKHHVIENW
jgi:hypothetical protein